MRTNINKALEYVKKGLNDLELGHNLSAQELRELSEIFMCLKINRDLLLKSTSKLGYNKNEIAQMLGATRHTFNNIFNTTKLVGPLRPYTIGAYPYNTARDQKIRQMVKSGVPRKQIAKDFNISLPRISQIVSNPDALNKSDS